MIAGIAKADATLEAELKEALRDSGGMVRDEAAQLFGRYSEKTAAGYRVYVRARGVSVEQSLRKTTGKRPDWGRIQMKDALIPALDEKTDAVRERVVAAIDAVTAFI